MRIPMYQPAKMESHKVMAHQLPPPQIHKGFENRLPYWGKPTGFHKPCYYKGGPRVSQAERDRWNHQEDDSQRVDEEKTWNYPPPSMQSSPFFQISDACSCMVRMQRHQLVGAFKDNKRISASIPRMQSSPPGLFHLDPFLVRNTYKFQPLIFNGATCECLIHLKHFLENNWWKVLAILE